jgi:hypothetical protein
MGLGMGMDEDPAPTGLLVEGDIVSNPETVRLLRDIAPLFG